MRRAIFALLVQRYKRLRSPSQPHLHFHHSIRNTVSPGAFPFSSPIFHTQPAKMANPEVFFDITADGAPVGRILMTVSRGAGSSRAGRARARSRGEREARGRGDQKRKNLAAHSWQRLLASARWPTRWRVVALLRRPSVFRASLAQRCSSFFPHTPPPTICGRCAGAPLHPHPSHHSSAPTSRPRRPR